MGRSDIDEFHRAYDRITDAYVALDTKTLALVWIYYAAMIVFLGALATAVVDERAKSGKRKSRQGSTT